MSGSHGRRLKVEKVGVERKKKLEKRGKTRNLLDRWIGKREVRKGKRSRKPL